MGFPALDETKLEEAVADLRMYLRDSEGLNTLLAGKEENTDDQLKFAIRMGLGWFNMVSPYTNFNLTTLPESAYIFLMNEAVIEVLFSSGLLHSRNNLAYSSGGLSVNDHDKTGEYQGWMNVIQSLKQMRQMEKQYKIQRNIESCFGGQSSEFYDSYYTDDWKILD